MGKGSKSLTFYALMLVVFSALIYFIAKTGEGYQHNEAVSAAYKAPADLTEGFGIFKSLLFENIDSAMSMLLLQIIVILIFCRIFGWIAMKIGQPTVIGEIVAGIVLGPSILGYWFPEATAFLFPPESLGNINTLSQFGLILFMFAIGMELDIGEVRKKLNETILISHTSTVIPFFLGMLTALLLYDKYAYESTPFISFALFIGISMSITAFPVLARIIQEKGLTKSHLGTISLASAANGDITAWCLLAVVVAIAQAGNMSSAIYNIMFSFLYLAIMFLVIRPFLRMVGQVYHNKEVVDKGLVAFMFLLLIVSSYLTEILGLHALFGAFMAGVVMPPNMKFRKIMAEKVEDVSLSLFLPLFFVSTGLRTEIGLLNTPGLWGLCGLVTLAAITGKFGGAMISARFSGESWKSSLYIGALMNTRGLMELVVLAIGYEMEILPPAIFVMLVLMTLVTTFMTAPLISLIKAYFKRKEKVKEMKRQARLEGVFNVMLSFGRASNGQVMLDVAHQMFCRGDNKLQLTALHLTVGPDVNPLHTDNFEEVSFGPILYGAKKLGMNINTRYEVSTNPGHDICSIVNEEGFDFLLVGSGISMSNLPDDVEANRYRSAMGKYAKRFYAPESWFSPGHLLKDKTKMFFEEANCPVGVFVNRNFVKATQIILIIDDAGDLFLLNYAHTLQKETKGAVSILCRASAATTGIEAMVETFDKFLETVRRAKMLEERDLSQALLADYDFMLISYKTWNNVSEHRNEALQKMPSTLILNK